MEIDGSADATRQLQVHWCRLDYDPTRPLCSAVFECRVCRRQRPRRSTPCTWYSCVRRHKSLRKDCDGAYPIPVTSARRAARAGERRLSRSPHPARRFLSVTVTADGSRLYYPPPSSGICTVYPSKLVLRLYRLFQFHVYSANGPDSSRLLPGPTTRARASSACPCKAA